jgi:hypothetical protein
MYRFYRKINANGPMNTEIFTEGNEGNERGPVYLIRNRATKSTKTDSLRLGPIAFTNRQPFVAFAALL